MPFSSCKVSGDRHNSNLKKLGGNTARLFFLFLFIDCVTTLRIYGGLTLTDQDMENGERFGICKIVIKLSV